MLTRWRGNGNFPSIWGPSSSSLSAFQEFEDRMNRLFEEFERGFGLESFGGTRWPQVDMYDTGSAYVVTMDVPGFKEGDLDVNVDDNTLTVKGHREESYPEDHTVHLRERAGTYDFSRSFTLPGKVNFEKTSANLKDGVLTITLEKTEETRPRQISVKGS